MDVNGNGSRTLLQPKKIRPRLMFIPLYGAKYWVAVVSEIIDVSALAQVRFVNTVLFLQPSSACWPAEDCVWTATSRF